MHPDDYSIHLLNIIDPAINLPSEEIIFSILSVSWELMCINWNEPEVAACIIQADFEQGLSMSWWM